MREKLDNLSMVSFLHANPLTGTGLPRPPFSGSGRWVLLKPGDGSLQLLIPINGTISDRLL